MILTDDEIDALWADEPSVPQRVKRRELVRIAQTAVLRKLATVSVEPDLIKTDEVDRYGDSIYIEAYSAEALAAARVQAIEEAASRVKEFNHPLVNLTIDGRARLATEIRALIT